MEIEMYNSLKTPVIFLVIMTLSGCASTGRPVLYPNAHLNSVGMQMADSDIDSCIVMANNAGASRDELSETATETAEGAVVGGATGAAVGAVLGNAGQGAATGAAGGATSRFTRSLFDSDRPDPIFQRYVNRCLRDKGYDPIGWN
jgi:hypothetical protein